MIVPPHIIHYILAAVVGLYLIAALLYFFRLLKVKEIPDMVIIIDAVTYDLAVFIVVFSLLIGNPYLAVAALPLALWAYVLDIYMSKYLEGRELGD